MSLVAGCPRCRAAEPLADGTPRCPVHGVVSRRCGGPRTTPRSSYDVFVDHLGTAGHLPDVPAVADEPRLVGHRLRGRRRTTGPWATATCVSGTSELDGPVDVFVVAEEPGTGLGARCAGIDSSDPGREVGDGQPTVRVRIGSQSVSAVGRVDGDVRRPLRPLGLRRRGRRPVAVAGAAAGLGDAAAARRLDPARRLRPSGRPWSRCRSEGRAPSGEPGAGAGAYRPPHPLARLRRHADARRS